MMFTQKRMFQKFYRNFIDCSSNMFGRTPTERQTISQMVLWSGREQSLARCAIARSLSPGLMISHETG